MDLPVITAAAAPAARPANPHFVQLGGAPVVGRLVDSFYAAMDTLPEAQTIRAMHGADLQPVKQVLVAYLSEWLGGPRLYSPLRGAPKLGRVHRPYAIGPAERDAWMRCMKLALAEHCPDPTLRTQLEAAFRKVAEHLTTPQPALTPAPTPGD
jgi:hemoglobin